MAFKDSYHGTFFGGVSVSGIDQDINSSFYPKYGDVTFVDYPTSIEQEKRSEPEFVNKTLLKLWPVSCKIFWATSL